MSETKFHLHLKLADGNRLGPGKADLLAAIRETGSIAAAGRLMGMSYRRAWLLIDGLNRGFDLPLVEAARGGAAGGAAGLTPRGEAVLAAYRQAEAATRQAIAAEAARLAKWARPLPD